MYLSCSNYKILLMESASTEFSEIIKTAFFFNLLTDDLLFFNNYLLGTIVFKV